MQKMKVFDRFRIVLITFCATPVILLVLYYSNGHQTVSNYKNTQDVDPAMNSINSKVSDTHVSVENKINSTNMAKTFAKMINENQENLANKSKAAAEMLRPIHLVIKEVNLSSEQNNKLPYEGLDMTQGKPLTPLSELTDASILDFLKRHTNEGVLNILQKRDQGNQKKVKNPNPCLAFKPTKYVKNDARIFSKDELDLKKYNDSKSLIPKIIHQTWNTYNLPTPAVPFVKSIVKQNPGWEYWFWTQQDIQCYLQQKHPDFVDLYNDYQESIFRTDVMRYFILYDYGGFYIDLDVECLKPLDVWTYIGSTILSHETYEHTFMGHMREQPNVMTTVLATAPGHPYYKLLQDNLSFYHRVCPKNVLYSTGPFYIDNIYQLYAQGYARETDPEITIIHPRYWLPKAAGHYPTKLRRACGSPSAKRALTKQQKEFKLCENALNRTFYNGPYPDSYLNHFWMNSNIKSSKFRTKDTTSILDIVPNLRKVSDILGLKCDSL